MFNSPHVPLWETSIMKTDSDIPVVDRVSGMHSWNSVFAINHLGCKKRSAFKIRKFFL
jgi:hypothetical protein